MIGGAVIRPLNFFVWKIETLRDFLCGMMSRERSDQYE